MSGTRGKADTEVFCPYCKTGRLVKDIMGSGTVCDGCGAEFEEAVLYRRTSPELPLLKFRNRQKKERLANAAERNIAFAMSELERLASDNALGRRTKEEALSIYRKAVSRNLVRGRSIESLVAASTYAACRTTDTARTLDEISESSGVDKKELGRTYRHLAHGLRLDLLPARPQTYIRRFGTILRMSDTTQSYAVELLNRAESMDRLSGLGPSGAAAAALYISGVVNGEHRSQREVSEAAEISEVTLRSRYSKLAGDLGITLEFK